MKKSMTWLVALGALLVAGCAPVKVFPRVTLPFPRDTRMGNCDHRDIVLSNLTRPMGQRTYWLRPGEACHDRP